MPIEIKRRRVVPDKDGYNHRGQHASLAMDEAGYRAWGFGNTKAKADKNAQDNVFKVKRSLNL